MNARYPVMMIMILSVLLTCLVGCGSTPSENPADLSETVTASTEGNAALTEFTAETLDGSEFSPETLAAADLTVLNIWQTTCPPCIREMPELAELERKTNAMLDEIGLTLHRRRQEQEQEENTDNDS